MNLGKRNYNAADLGIDQQGRPNYFDFTAGLKRSEQLLASLESGKDLLWQAKGDQKRHYWMEESGEIMPYRVYVPPSWDGKTPLPMVFILHGNTRNQDFYFERDGGIIPKEAQQRGFMLVGVFGYYPNGGYNSGMLNRGRIRGGGRRGGADETPPMNGMPQSRIGELSEIGTMHVLELVKEEYPIDQNRTFLFGYSAGGSVRTTWVRIRAELGRHRTGRRGECAECRLPFRPAEEQRHSRLYLLRRSGFCRGTEQLHHIHECNEGTWNRLCSSKCIPA